MSDNPSTSSEGLYGPHGRDPIASSASHYPPFSIATQGLQFARPQPRGNHEFDPGGSLETAYGHHQYARLNSNAGLHHQNRATYPSHPTSLNSGIGQQASVQAIRQHVLPERNYFAAQGQINQNTSGPPFSPGPSDPEKYQTWLSDYYPTLPTDIDENSRPFGLAIRQEPQRGLLAVVGKERNRKPLDPPLFVEFRVPHHVDPFQLHLVNTGLFGIVQLWHSDKDEPHNKTGSGDFLGTIVSSIHKFKGQNDRDGAWMIWGDLSCLRIGTFRLKVTLLERRDDVVREIQSLITSPFEVMQSKEFPGLDESTYLTRSFADQGAKVRIRKEPNKNRPGQKRPLGQDVLSHQQPSPGSAQFYGASSYNRPPSEDDESPTKRSKYEEGTLWQQSHTMGMPFAATEWAGQQISTPYHPRIDSQHQLIQDDTGYPQRFPPQQLQGRAQQAMSIRPPSSSLSSDEAIDYTSHYIQRGNGLRSHHSVSDLSQYSPYVTSPPSTSHDLTTASLLPASINPHQGWPGTEANIDNVDYGVS